MWEAKERVYKFHWERISKCEVLLNAYMSWSYWEVIPDVVANIKNYINWLISKRDGAVQSVQEWKTNLYYSTILLLPHLDRYDKIDNLYRESRYGKA